MSFVLLVLAIACGGSSGDPSGAGAPAAPSQPQPGAPTQQPSSPAQQPSAPAEQWDAVAPEVPFIDQNHPAGAEASYDGTENCGPTLVAGIAKSRNTTFGLRDAQLIEFLGSIAGTSPVDGTTGHGMIFVLEALGMQTNAVPGADLDWIDAELVAGHVVIANGDFYAVPGREQKGVHAGHYIAVTAVGSDWTRYRVTDPWDGDVTSLTDAQLYTYITSNPAGGFTISAW